MEIAIPDIYILGLVIAMEIQYGFDIGHRRPQALVHRISWIIGAYVAIIDTLADHGLQ